MPASETSATVCPAAHPLHQLRGAALLVVLVVGDERAPRRRSGRAASRVRRVSSQATTSASRRAESTRSVTSSRFPIGVGQTTRLTRRAAFRASSASSAAPSIPDSSPNAAGTIRTPAGCGRQRPLGHHLARGLEQQVAGRHGAAADHDHLGVERVHDAGEPRPQPAPDLGQHLDRAGVAGVRQLGDERAGDLAPRRPAAGPSADSGVALRPRSAPRARWPLPEASTSRQPRPGQPPGHSRAVVVDHHVPELAAEPVRAAVEAPVEHQRRRRSRCRASAAQRARRPGRAVAVLGEHRDVGVVVDVRPGSPRRSLIRSRNGTSSSGRWFDHSDRPRAKSTSDGMPEAHGVHVRGRGAHLLDRLDDDVERLLAVGAAPERWTRWRTPVLVDHAAEKLRAAGVDRR